MTSNKPGRGKGQKNDNKTSKKFNSNTKKYGVKDEDLKFYIGDQQAEKYDRIIKILAAEAQREYGYSIAYVIEYQKEFTFEQPKLQLSEETNEKAKEVEQQAFDMIFAQEIKMLTQKKTEYARNKEKICSIIQKKMSAGLEETMKKEKDFPIKREQILYGY